MPRCIGFEGTISCSGVLPLPERWESEEQYAEHMAAKEKTSAIMCSRGVGECCLAVTLRSFNEEGNSKTAKIIAVCESSDCREAARVTSDAFFNVASGGDHTPDVGRVFAGARSVH